MARQHHVFLAFAGNLPGVNKEAWELTALFERLHQKGHCEKPVVEARASLEQIFSRLIELRDRIAIFHFGGHAEPGRLLMESAFEASPAAEGCSAYADGLAALLGQQRGLKLVFLNGCSTRPQVQRLITAGVPAVIATARPIRDDVAFDFALAFYTALTTGGDEIKGGQNILGAFAAAHAFTTAR
jgi:hypothetical protein